jgi:hypothetical protein
MPLPICPTSGTVGGSIRVTSPCGVTITLGYDMPVGGISGGSVYAAVTASATTMVGCPTTITDAFHAPASCCPPADIIAAVDGTCPVGVVALADGDVPPGG